MILDTVNECNTLGCKLNIDDRDRIRLLLDAINTHGIEFKYFLTLDYWWQMKNVSRVLEDNRHLKKILQSFFKCPIDAFFFTEKHQSEAFHRHILLGDIPDYRWLNPTTQMQTFMLELSPEMLFRCLSGEVPSVKDKMNLMQKVIKGLHASTPNGELGLRLMPIHNVEGLLSYCTKQNQGNIPHEYVIDSGNSSHLDDEFIRRLHAHIRCQRTFV